MSYDPRDLDRARFAEAVRARMLERDLTQAALADTLGVTHPTVSDWLRQKKTPGRKNLHRVLETLDIDWAFVTSRRETAAPKLGEEDDVVRIPRLARVSAGDGIENGRYPDDEGESYYSRQELRRLTNRNPAALRALVVEGDSMEPDIRANDTIIYIPTREVNDDGIYVLVIDEATKVKRVQRFGGGALEIIPSNPAYGRERLLPLRDADAPHLYRSETSGLVTEVRVEGKVVFHPRPL